jgi:hypothetical protein
MFFGPIFPGDSYPLLEIAIRGIDNPWLFHGSCKSLMSIQTGLLPAKALSLPFVTQADQLPSSAMVLSVG